MALGDEIASGKARDIRLGPVVLVRGIAPQLWTWVTSKVAASFSSVCIIGLCTNVS